LYHNLLIFKILSIHFIPSIYDINFVNNTVDNWLVLSNFQKQKKNFNAAKPALFRSLVIANFIWNHCAQTLNQSMQITTLQGINAKSDLVHYLVEGAFTHVRSPFISLHSL